MVHQVDEAIYGIYVCNEVVKSTGIHKFWILRNGKWEWMEAQNLVVGDCLLTSEGNTCEISRIDLDNLETSVYNI